MFQTIDTHQNNDLSAICYAVLEELSEVFLEGDDPEYLYDEETATYFRNRELIEKSKEYREYKEFPEKKKEP